MSYMDYGVVCICIVIGLMIIIILGEVLLWAKSFILKKEKSKDFFISKYIGSLGEEIEDSMDMFEFISALLAFGLMLAFVGLVLWPFYLFTAIFISIVLTLRWYVNREEK